MKRKLCFIFSFIFLLTTILTTTIFANDVSLCNNNTMSTYTSFSISSTGEAQVTYEYAGYKNITTGAVITIIIEKRNFLFFWEEIDTEYLAFPDESYMGTYGYQLSSKGTYRCTVTYRIGGTGGEDDVITFEDTDTY